MVTDSVTYISLPACVSAGYGAFFNCLSLSVINLPSLINAGQYCFGYNNSYTWINIPNCTNLGGTVFDDGVFTEINGLTLDLNISSTLMTCNSGYPDVDVCYLCSNNNVTVNGVPNYICSITTTTTTFNCSYGVNNYATESNIF